jgi:hypothetical protein
MGAGADRRGADRGRRRAAGRRFPALLRNVAGITGIGLLSAAVLGEALAWAGPMAYLVLTETALAGNVTTPWVWPARPPAEGPDIGVE